jgi:hypothetical protein
MACPIRAVEPGAHERLPRGGADSRLTVAGVPWLLTAAPGVVTLRGARADDELAVAVLAQLDSARVIPPAPRLLAEVDGRLRAALSLHDGSAIADPFFRTTHLLALLRAHATSHGLAGSPKRHRARLQSARAFWIASTRLARRTRGGEGSNRSRRAVPLTVTSMRGDPLTNPRVKKGNRHDDRGIRHSDERCPPAPNQ